MAFALVANSVRAYPVEGNSPLRYVFEQILEFNVTALASDQELDLAALAAADSTNGPAITTLLSQVSRMNGCMVLQAARADAGAYAAGTATISNVANLLPVADVNVVTFPAKAAAADGDFIQLTDAAGGKWAITLDTDGGGVANAGPIYAASTPIVVDISTGVLAPSVAALVFAALPAPFLAVFDAVDNLDGTITITAKTAGDCAAAVKKNAAEAGDGSITFVNSVVGRNADSVSVAGVAFVAQAAAVVAGQATFRATVDVNTTAVSLAAQINAHATSGALVTATARAAPSGVVDIVAKERGAEGNTIALAYTDGAGQVSVGAAVSGAFLSGGLPTAGYSLHGTAQAPVFAFPGGAATPTALHFVLRYKLNRDESPFIYNAV